VGAASTTWGSTEEVEPAYPDVLGLKVAVIESPELVVVYLILHVAVPDENVVEPVKQESVVEPVLKVTVPVAGDPEPGGSVTTVAV